MAILKALAEEHKLIAEMIHIINEALVRAGGTGKLNLQTVNAAIDFMAIFSGEFHHGKEEKLLFKEFEKRNPRDEHIELLRELYRDHKKARELVDKLSTVRDEYFYTQGSSLIDLLRAMKEAADFYGAHIDKEDGRLFPALIEYYSGRELETLAERFRDYDANFVMKRYGRIKERLSNNEEAE
jgi:hemerythrin-like domain-containing protein